MQRTGNRKENFGRKPNTSSKLASLQTKRPRFCGVWTLHGRARRARAAHAPGAGLITPSRRFLRLRCKCWACSICGPRKANKYRGQILRAVTRHKLARMLTLTLDARKFATLEQQSTFFEHLETHKALGTACQCETCTRIQTASVRHIRTCWNKLRVSLLRRYGVAPKYVAVLEFQKATGLAHLHIVIDRYIPQAWAKEAWQAVGGGQHVHIRHADAHRIAPYLAKYLSKELLLSGVPGMRRVTTSRTIKLDEKKQSEYCWEVCRSSIDRMYVFFRDLAIEEVHSDGELESFGIRE